MATLEAAGTKYALGLDWSASGRADSASARRGRAGAVGPVGHVELRTANNHIQTATTTDTAHLGLPSAAAALAARRKPMILLQPLSGDQIWLCATIGGEVWPSGDMTGKLAGITVRLNEIREDMRPEPAIHDPSGLLGRQTGSGFAALIDGLPAAATIKPIRNRKPAIRRIAASAAAVTAIATIGYFLWPEKEAPPPPKTTVAVDTLQMERERQLAELHAALEQNAPLLLTTLLDAAYDRPLFAGGWQQTGYEWRPDSGLTALWIRRHGTIASITDHIGTSNWQLDESATAIRESVELPPLPAAAFDLETMMTTIDRHGMIDRLAALEGTWRLDRQSAPNTAGITTAAITGQTSSLVSATTIAAALSDIPVRITSATATISRQGRTGWRYEGIYYERTRTP